MPPTPRLPVRVGVATVASAIVSLAVSAPASAHVGPGAHGARAGLLHPVTGLDHLLAIVAVGIVAATWSRSRDAWIAPVTFMGAMVAGGIAGLVGLPLPGAEAMIAASVVLLGLVVADALRADGRWVVPALAVAGLAHGHAHGAEAPAGSHPATYLAAFLVATAALHLAGFSVGTAVRRQRLVRVGLGAATATAGVLLFI